MHLKLQIFPCISIKSKQIPQMHKWAYDLENWLYLNLKSQVFQIVYYTFKQKKHFEIFCNQLKIISFWSFTAQGSWLLEAKNKNYANHHFLLWLMIVVYLKRFGLQFRFERQNNKTVPLQITFFNKFLKSTEKLNSCLRPIFRLVINKVERN